MKLSTKIAAGTLSGFGLLLSGTLSWLLWSSATKSLESEWICYPSQVCFEENVVKKRQFLLTLLMVGLPSTAAGLLLLWQGYSQDQRQQNHLRIVFFNLLQANNGHITPIRFAMESGLDGKLAKVYLDERAREFNATYNISEEGNVMYHFDLSDANRQFPDLV